MEPKKKLEIRKKTLTAKKKPRDEYMERMRKNPRHLA